MKILRKIKTVQKTISFNFKVFPLKISIKSPILISHKVQTHNLYKGCISINSPISRFMIRININHNKNGYLSVYSKPIIVGDNVWIGANVDIMKNTEITNGYIIGYRSCVIKKFTEQNCIIVGYQVKIIQNNIRLKK